MTEPKPNFKPLPKRNSRGSRKGNSVGGNSQAKSRGKNASRSAADKERGAPPAHPPGKPKKPGQRSLRNWLKSLAFVAVVGTGVYALANLQPPPPTPPAPIDTEATLVPTSPPLFPFLNLPAPPTLAPTFTPTPVFPDVAVIAGHWSKASPDGEPTVHDSGAVCPSGLREVDITKAVADRLVAILEGRSYRVVLMEEFDDRLKKVNPDFAPRVLVSIHADSCLTGPEYAFATGYKIAHAQPSQNPEEDGRLVTCLTRAYDRAVSPFNLGFNANTITRDMTEYHAFREIEPTTPAAIIELGFLGYDAEILTNRQDDLARGLAVGIDDFLKGDPCAPPTATPEPTETLIP